MTDLDRIVKQAKRRMTGGNPQRFILALIKCPGAPTPNQIRNLKYGTAAVETLSVFRCASTPATDRLERQRRHADGESIAGEPCAVELPTAEADQYRGTHDVRDATTGGTSIVFLAPLVGPGAFNYELNDDTDIARYVGLFDIDNLMTDSEIAERLASSDYEEPNE